MPLKKVISGGQTGVDRAALIAATAHGIPTGGYLPKGWIAEDRPHPEYKKLYSMMEHPNAGYPPRTRTNAQDADATLLLMAADQTEMGAGSKLTIRYAHENFKVSWVARITPGSVEDVALWLESQAVEVLNVAGSRESSQPGIQAAAVEWLGLLFERLGFPAQKGQK